MHRFFLALLFPLFPLLASSQGEALSPDQEAFDRAVETYNRKNFENAILAFKNIIQDYPGSKLLGRAKYNLAYIYSETNQTDKAIPIFKEILNSKFEEKDGFGSLMEQYALYKHRSSTFLADIYLKQKNYLTALKYNKIADKKYPYKHFHITERTNREIYLALNYAKIYQGLNKHRKSLKYMVPYIFHGRNYITKYLIISLDSLYSQEQIKAELKNAIKNLAVKSRKEYAVVRLWGSKLKIHQSLLFGDINDPKIEEYLELEEIYIYHKIIELHPLFNHYSD